MAALPNTGLLDLEKELTCSICTEVLYQPLTLLDCLHAFCGSCLTDWFNHVASSASSDTANPFTCPSCRAPVRDTRPNAQVTTLLEMFLKANPAKGRTTEEKEEMRKKYKPGDNVIPQLDTASSTDEDERRMLEEVREMSLRDLGSRGPRSYERGVRHRPRSRDEREEEVRQRRRRDGHSAGVAPTSPTDSRSQARQIGHQASLRSLLSASDVDSAEIEEEILRQILEEGLLDGIDLNNLDTTQEDELSERIAEAYRRRHHLQSSRSSPEARSEGSRGSRGHTRRTSDHSSPRRHHGAADQSAHSSHPPVSRPHLLETTPPSRGHRRRTTSETRRRTSPVPDTPPVRHEAARSATDLSNRPRRAESRERRPSEITSHGRRVTDPRPRRLSEGVRQHSHSLSTTESNMPPINIPPIRSSQAPAGSERTPTLRTSEFASLGRADPAAGASRQVQLEAPNNVESGSSRPASSSSATQRARATPYVEPSINCERCKKPDIEYELHENCSACKDGNYNICHRCYRSGRGCLHWYGFGQSAWHRFHQQTSSVTTLPHTLVGHRYQRPKPESLQPSTGSEISRMTTEDPSKRLESGAFCSNCSAFANDCFLKCGSCNDGEWGFCNRCVNQGKCCTHPLLPVAHVSTIKDRDGQPSNNAHTGSSFQPMLSPRAAQSFPSNLASAGEYRPLTYITDCDICKWSVQPSQTRFHCYECNDGDYDICATCYSKLNAMGRISRENGERGWRRCLRGHRMVLVGFEDTSAGQRRVIVRDLVGGHALKDEAGGTASTKQEWSWRDGQERQTRTVSRQVGSSLEGSTASPVPLLQKYPPDGGVGMIVCAKWAYLPQEGVEDELSFPKGAEIREVEDINGDWFWGCYAGAKGLFPASYVRVLDLVTM